MHTVKNAVIMAAGKGERLRPVTLSTPKPLIRVNGRRMADTIISALKENGIHEIYVVTGYMKEQFGELEARTPGLTLIENPYWESCNNISSLYAAADVLGDTMILDGDQMILDPGALSPGFELSGYNAVRVTAHTDEWVMSAENGIVTGCSRTGGDSGWQLYSISRWSAGDSAKLREFVRYEFETAGNRHLYWDDIPVFRYPGEFRLGIREMRADAVREIDTLEELAEIDKSYSRYLLQEDEI